MTATAPKELRERMVEAIQRAFPYLVNDRTAPQIVDAALSAADSADFQLVPKEATEAMIVAGHDAVYHVWSQRGIRECYAAMLAAAPKVSA